MKCATCGGEMIQGSAYCSDCGMPSPPRPGQGPDGPPPVGSVPQFPERDFVPLAGMPVCPDKAPAPEKEGGLRGWLSKLTPKKRP